MERVQAIDLRIESTESPSQNLLRLFCRRAFARLGERFGTCSPGLRPGLLSRSESSFSSTIVYVAPEVEYPTGVKHETQTGVVGVGGASGGSFLGAAEFGGSDFAAAGSVAIGPDHLSHRVVWALCDQVVLGGGVEWSCVSVDWPRCGSIFAVGAFASGSGVEHRG